MEGEDGANEDVWEHLNELGWIKAAFEGAPVIKDENYYLKKVEEANMLEQHEEGRNGKRDVEHYLKKAAVAKKKGLKRKKADTIRLLKDVDVVIFCSVDRLLYYL